MSLSLGGSAEKSSSDTSTSGASSEISSVSGTQSTKTNLDSEAISHMLNEALGGNQGLSAVFAGEQTAGVYNGTVAAEASGDLVTKIIGELAALTAEEVTTTEGTTTTDSIFEEDSDTDSKKAGFNFGLG